MTALYAKYGKEKVDAAVGYLSYHKPDPLPKEESNQHPVMYVFRHGQSIDNADFIFSGWRVSPLTKIGREQVEILAEKLKDKRVDMLISSPQERALETMKIAISHNEKARDLEVHTDKRIMERCYGDYQGQSKIEFHLRDPEGLRKIRRDFKNVPPNGESLEMVCTRVKDFCDEVTPLMKKNNINIAVSCHGNSIRGFRKYFENLSEERTAEIETPLGQDYASYIIR